ncbi:DNA repair protein RecN [Porphyromonas pogonae]|uniref:DNA repair protein RecN n=1 Tax=Porphyromonas pogonae TaxID=867595 RepID=UPI002E79553A|nr:DNA repair protein RecN [Porphyromonas pogonae]
MLNTLYIKNYVLIESLKIQFHPHFSVITGETGAGKSIILGALSLLTGNRADPSVIRPGIDKCIIEASFTNIGTEIKEILSEAEIDVDDYECIVRREISVKGKSRAFVNDTPASVSLLKILSEHLIDIHSQHKNLLLGDTHFQLSVLDLYAGNQNLLKEYKCHYNEYNKLKEVLRNKEEALEAGKKEQDYMEFQWNQLNELNPQPDELEQLEEEEKILSHSLDIKLGLTNAYESLYENDCNAMSCLKYAHDSLNATAKYYPQSEELFTRLHSIQLELEDIAQTISRESEKINYDPQRLSIIRERLDALNSLLLKHNVTTSNELIAFKDELERKLMTLSNSDNLIQELKAELSQKHKELTLLAEELSAHRHKAAQHIITKLIESLKELGIPFIRFDIAFAKYPDLHETGYDQVTYLFSANKELPIEPVANIASGGEISRLMLSLKALIADKKSLPSIIFDEIDTGVSGDIAEKIGFILQRMGHTMQVIAVTHLPQIAASGNSHYFVYKDSTNDTTVSTIKELSKQERIEEIARMQSGNNLSEISLAAAKQLLEQSHS